MINSVIMTNKYVGMEIPKICLSCVINIIIANAFTNPIITEFGINFISLPIFNNPKMI